MAGLARRRAGWWWWVGVGLFLRHVFLVKVVVSVHLGVNKNE